MNLDLGGPGPGCSVMRVRRLSQGELLGGEKARTEEHVQGCARCGATLRELAAEREQLLREVPFDAFAAGVAEKLAARQRPARRPFAARWAPVAAAAAVLLIAGGALLRREEQPQPWDGIKGAATAQLFVQDSRGVHELTSGEKLSRDVRLQLTLHPASRKEAAVVLIEPGEQSVLYAGPAVNGALPSAFEWSGNARSATLLVIFTDAPLDAARIHDKADVPRGADVSQVVLQR